jgi:hypothetical protein
MSSVAELLGPAVIDHCVPFHFIFFSVVSRYFLLLFGFVFFILSRHRLFRGPFFIIVGVVVIRFESLSTRVPGQHR